MSLFCLYITVQSVLTFMSFPFAVENKIVNHSSMDQPRPHTRTGEAEIPFSNATEEVSEEEPRLSVRSLSSPDFMKSYKASFDAERDWPPIDLDEDDDVMLDEVDSNQQPQNSVLDMRRGSSAERLRRRKRFDTDRV